MEASLVLLRNTAPMGGQHFVDYHVHSTLSIDGRSTIEDMCQSALLSGLDEVGFAEHMDFEIEDPRGCSILNYEKYSSAIDKAREEFEDRLTIRKGVEIDYQSRHLGAIEQWLKGKRFDFKIGSVHFVDGKPIDLGNADDGMLRSLYPAYCREVALSVKSGYFDIVGHFDLISSFCSVSIVAKKRYLPSVLNAILDSKVHLEVNSRGFREGRNDTIPDSDMLREFFLMGGHRVSFGSDAHSADTVGSGIRESLASILKLTSREFELPF